MDTLQHYQYLRSQRAQVETTWRKIAQMLAPDSDQFWSNWYNATKDLLRNQHIYDSTPQNALTVKFLALLVPSPETSTFSPMATPSAYS